MLNFIVILTIPEILVICNRYCCSQCLSCMSLNSLGAEVSVLHLGFNSLPQLFIYNNLLHPLPFPQLKNLNNHQLDVAAMLKERNQQGVESDRQEKSKNEAARREANNIRKSVEREASERQEADLKAAPVAKEKEKLENALQFPERQYQMFTWEEIETATSSFSQNLKIGMGAYGTVYKCNLHHTIAAVKVLRAKGNHETKHFQKEV